MFANSFEYLGLRKRVSQLLPASDELVSDGTTGSFKLLVLLLSILLFWAIHLQKDDDKVNNEIGFAQILMRVPFGTDNLDNPHSQPLVSLTDTVSGTHTASTTKWLVQ